MAYNMKSSPAKLGAALRTGKLLVKYGKKMFTKTPKKTVKSTDDIEADEINKIYEKFKQNIRDKGTKSSPVELKKSDVGFSVAGPIFDSQGKCYANCAQRSFEPKHNFSIGTKLDVNRKSGEWSGGLGGYAGYTKNPDYGKRQQGVKGYLGGNYGADFSKFGSLDSEAKMPTVKPYAQAVASLGYEGEVGDAGSYKNYKRGRRGDPKKWGVGGFVKKGLIGNKGYAFGGYAKYGNLNVTAGNKGVTVGFGKTIR